MTSMQVCKLSRDRVAIIGGDLFSNLHWSYQQNKLGIWTNWAPIIVQHAIRHTTIAVAAVGVGSNQSPCVIAQTATPIDGSSFHVLQGKEDNEEKWTWSRNGLPDPPLFIGGNSRLHVIPVRNNGANHCALIVQDSAAVFISYETPQTTASSWSSWSNITDPTDIVVSVHGTTCCGEALLVVATSAGQIRIAQHLGMQSWSPWKTVGTVPGPTKVQSITDALGVVHLLVSDRGGRIYHSAEQRVGQCGAGGWSPFVDVGLSPARRNALKDFSLVIDDNDRVQIVAQLQNGLLLHSWQKNWRNHPGYLSNVLVDGRGKFGEFLPILYERDKFKHFCAFSDPIGRVHVVGVRTSDHQPEHAIIWGHRIHIRAVKCRDDATHPQPRPELNTTYENFAEVLARCNAIFSNTGIQFVCDPKSDWVDLADTAINRDFAIATGDNADHWAYAEKFSESVVCFLRWGGAIRYTGGSYSGGPNPDPYGIWGKYVAFAGWFDSNGAADGINLGHGSHVAHELGHYLGLQHTFGSFDYHNVNDRPAVFQALIDQVLKDIGPDDSRTDVDRSSGVYDTPFDPGDKFYVQRGNVAGNAQVEVTGTYGGTAVRYLVAPDVNNVMSYFAGNPAVGEIPPAISPFRFSPDQIVVMHKALRHQHRRGLLRPPIT